MPANRLPSKQIQNSHLPSLIAILSAALHYTNTQKYLDRSEMSDSMADKRVDSTLSKLMTGKPLESPQHSLGRLNTIIETFDEDQSIDSPLSEMEESQIVALGIAARHINAEELGNSDGTGAQHSKSDQITSSVPKHGTSKKAQYLLFNI